MKILCYDALPETAADIRRAVFMDEQGFQREFDELDARSHHLVVYDGDTPAGTCRLYRRGSPPAYVVGRIAVLPPWRGRGLGARLLREAERLARAQGGRFLSLHAQIRAAGFYEKQGYRPYGKVALEEGCPHIWMSKALEAEGI